MVNENCLSGLKCPNCDSLEPFIIAVTTTVLMYDDGSEADWKHSNGLDWDGNAPIQCKECGQEGTVNDFETR